MRGLRRALANNQVRLACAILGLFVLVALLAPVLAPPDDPANPSTTRVVGRARVGLPEPPSREALLGIRIAAVGSATARWLRHHGLPPTLVPKDFRAEGLVDEFRAMGPDACRRVLLPRAFEAREILPEALREMGCTVDVVTVYRVRPAPPEPDVLERLRLGTVDVVTFTSGAIADAFLSALSDAGMDAREVMKGLTVASIGPVTTEALAALGYSADIEAPEATMESLAAAVGAALAD